MNLTDIISKVNFTKAKPIFQYDIREMLGMPESHWEDSDWDEDSAMLEIPLETWICYDTIVEFQAYSFHREVVCFSMQNNRKAGKEYYWISEESVNKVLAYFLNTYPYKPRTKLMDDNILAYLKETIQYYK